MNLFRSILSLHENILRIFASPPEPERTFGIPYGPISVADYSKGYLRLLKPSHISDLVIKEVVMGKVNNIVGHELLVFKLESQSITVERRTRPEDIAVIFRSDDPLATLLGQEPNDLPIDERAALTQEVAKELTALACAMKAREDIRAPIPVNTNRAYDVILPGPPPYWSNIKKSSKKDVKDQVPKHGKFKLYTYRILPSDTQPVFSMREAVIIANVIHESNELYNWGNRNCYWFAATMMAVIEELIKTEKVTHPGAKWAGRPVSSKLESLAPARELQASNINGLVDQVVKAIKKADDDMKKELELEAMAKRTEEAEAKTRQAEERTEALERKTEAIRRETEAIRRRETEAIRRETEAIRRRETEAIRRATEALEEDRARYHQEREEVLLQRIAQLTEQSGSAVASSSMTHPVAA